VEWRASTSLLGTSYLHFFLFSPMMFDPIRAP